VKKPNFDTTALKKQVEDQPLIALGIVAALLSGGAKMMNANTGRKYQKTWKREVKRREKNS
jgi:hypothetical protein